MRTILAIESTCDETAAAIVKRDGGGVEVLSNVVASSSEIHEKYGGVVPEVAAREQVLSIIPVVMEAMKKAEVEIEDLEGIAVAYGPGLIGSLLIGVETAKTLAYAWGKPLMAVNHMEAHVLANWIIEEGKNQIPELPALGLVVSGGHTDLILLRSMSEWEWLGGTRDDAAGECFDKCARILGLPYPGGPNIEREGEKATDEKIVVERLPRPMLDQDNLELSFSGLKSALASMAGKGVEKRLIPYLAREVNEAVAEVLVAKTMKAVGVYHPKSVLLAGGVAANKLLGSELEKKCEELGIKFFKPDTKYCTDNAVMIGAAALLRPNEVEVLELRPEPGLETVLT